MKNKKLTVLIFTILLVSFASISAAAPSYIWDGGNGPAQWYDVNKGNVYSGETYYCWATTAADALAWAGWDGWNSGTKSLISTPNDIYNTIKATWPDKDGSPLNAYEWWLTNRTVGKFTGDTFPSAGENFYPSVPIGVAGSVAAYASDATAGNIYSFLGTYIGDHRAIVASVHVSASTYGAYDHALAVWGWDPIADLIYVTDGDDGKTALDTYSFYQSGGQVYIKNYTNLYTTPVDIEITELDRLNLNSTGIEPNGYCVGASCTTATPEPATMLLLGLGLMGVLGIRRKIQK
jgi:hypothetical protein